MVEDVVLCSSGILANRIGEDFLMVRDGDFRSGLNSCLFVHLPRDDSLSSRGSSPPLGKIFSSEGRRETRGPLLKPRSSRAGKGRSRRWRGNVQMEVEGKPWDFVCWKRNSLLVYPSFLLSRLCLYFVSFFFSRLGTIDPPSWDGGEVQFLME